jgi:hypothetical protein
MMDHVPIYANSKARIVFVYAEAYGYSQEPWHMPQDAVMSHFLTFVNHGCNGTSNIGDEMEAGYTEFTIDLESLRINGIPRALQTQVSAVYTPHFDRDHAKHSTMCRTSKPISAGEELYDNYLSFGGDDYFEEMIIDLRRECSGEPGIVEQYQRGLKLEKITSLHGGDSATTEQKQHPHSSLRQEL